MSRIVRVLCFFICIISTQSCNSSNKQGPEAIDDLFTQIEERAKADTTQSTIKALGQSLFDHLSPDMGDHPLTRDECYLRYWSTVESPISIARHSVLTALTDSEYTASLTEKLNDIHCKQVLYTIGKVTESIGQKLEASWFLDKANTYYSIACKAGVKTSCGRDPKPSIDPPVLTPSANELAAPLPFDALPIIVQIGPEWLTVNGKPVGAVESENATSQRRLAPLLTAALKSALQEPDAPAASRNKPQASRVLIVADRQVEGTVLAGLIAACHKASRPLAFYGQTPKKEDVHTQDEKVFRQYVMQQGQIP